MAPLSPARTRSARAKSRAALLPVAGLASLLALGAGCLPPQDNPTNVHDLRVLGMGFEPPDVLIPECNAQMFAALAVASNPDAGIQIPDALLQILALRASVPLKFKMLIGDPTGNGRPIDYSIRACSNVNDRKCAFTDDFLDLESGTLTGGEFETTLSFGAKLLPDATPLLLEVIKQDTYKGLGGIRVPVVVHLKAPDTDEEIYAQKLMVYTCRFFPEMQQNVMPVLPGMTLEGTEWGADEVRELQGKGPFKLAPLDFTALEEPYVVPSLELKPVELVESWKISWFTDMGSMSPGTTGGSDFVTGQGRHNDEWTPDAKVTAAQDVNFWFVVRDGRGGESWIHRKAHWTP